MNGSLSGKKRKRTVDGEAARVRKKSTGAVKADDEQAEIILLEESILESRKNYNNIVKLIDHARGITDDHHQSVLAAVALCRVFTRLIVGGNLTTSKDSADSELTIIRWLKERLSEFENLLLDWLNERDPSIQSTALTLRLRLMKERAKLKQSSNDADIVLSAIIKHLIDGPTGSAVLDEFVDKYAQVYDDIRFNTFSALADSFSDNVSDERLRNALSMMISIKPLAADREVFHLFIDASSASKKGTKLYSEKAQKKQAQRAWMAIFGQSLSKIQRKQILEAMSNQIAPWFLNIELLMDFLTDSFNMGGSTALTAISGIFHLIQTKNLDYPQFYTKLYSFLDKSILHSKYRSRFFRLLAIFLDSTHLPAALVASFIKRLSRLSLHAPPSGIVVVVPLIYNLLQSHRTCTLMVHRTTELTSKTEDDWGDPFDMNEPNPMETGALESSIWEIETLQSHYHPNVATIAKIISQPFTKQSYNLEDFLDHTYATVCIHIGLRESKLILVCR